MIPKTPRRRTEKRKEGKGKGERGKGGNQKGKSPLDVRDTNEKKGILRLV